MAARLAAIQQVEVREDVRPVRLFFVWSVVCFVSNEKLVFMKCHIPKFVLLAVIIFKIMSLSAQIVIKQPQELCSYPW